MYDYYVGVDPGITGAIAIIDPDGQPRVEDCPTLDGRILDAEIASIFESFVMKGLGLFVGIEQAQVMPKQGIVSAFHYGEGFGVYRGIFAALKIPHVKIRPAAWKKAYGLLRQDKSESIIRALQLFPQVSDHLRLKKHHGRAEALLIAQYVRTMYRK